MDQQHALYCLGDPVFYDLPILHLREDEEFELACRPTPEGWHRCKTGDWVEYDPLDNRLPAQGWKIHASACTESAEEILQVVWDYCMERRIAFKFMRSQQLLFLRNAKYDVCRTDVLAQQRSYGQAFRSRVDRATASSATVTEGTHSHGRSAPRGQAGSTHRAARLA